MKHGLLKKFRIVSALLLLCGSAAAQQDSVQQLPQKVTAIRFHAQVQGGLLAGATPRAVQLQATGGVAYNSWAFGVGGGLDYYYLRTVPLFFDVRKTFSKAHILFVYADAGWNMPWIKSQRELWYTQHYKTGVYYDVGAGCNINVHQRNRFLISGGYSGKTLTEVQSEGIAKTKITYSLRRISLKLGFQF